MGRKRNCLVVMLRQVPESTKTKTLSVFTLVSILFLFFYFAHWRSQFDGATVESDSKLEAVSEAGFPLFSPIQPARVVRCLKTLPNIAVEACHRSPLPSLRTHVRVAALKLSFVYAMLKYSWRKMAVEAVHIIPP